MYVAVDTNCILPGVVGGIEHYTLGLLQRLTGTGSPADRVLVLTRPENHALFAGLSDRAGVTVVCQPRAAGNWDAAGSADALRQFQQQKRRLLHEHGVDVVHFPGNTINPIDLDLPIVLNLHDLQHRHFPEYFSDDELSRRERWWAASARRADVLIAASRFVAEDLHEQFGVQPERIVVTPDPLQTDFLAPPTDLQLATTRARLALAEAFFLYPAAIWPHKNHARLLEAFARLGPCGPTLVLTGGGQDDPALHARIASLNLHTRVRLLGRVDTLELRCLYRLATALVMPSEHESVSLPVFEAMASDCPIACSDATALPEQVGDAALLFAADDVSAMTTAMHLLLHEPTLRATLARRGRARLTQFDSNTFLAALKTAYDMAVRGFAASRAA